VLPTTTQGEIWPAKRQLIFGNLKGGLNAEAQRMDGSKAAIEEELNREFHGFHGWISIRGIRAIRD
jgi:hypothetical protein